MIFLFVFSRRIGVFEYKYKLFEIEINLLILMRKKWPVKVPLAGEKLGMELFDLRISRTYSS